MMGLWVWNGDVSQDMRWLRAGGVWGSLAWGWDWGEIRDADLFSRHVPLIDEVAPLLALDDSQLMKERSKEE